MINIKEQKRVCFYFTKETIDMLNHISNKTHIKKSVILSLLIESEYYNSRLNKEIIKGE